MLRMQQEQEAKTFTAKAGGGMVAATVNGKHELVNLEIKPDAVDPDDVEMLQDMVMAAVNEAMRAAETEAANNMSRLTGGLNLGGLF
jgi:DNA-binding YbaB/EbfC family protein